MRIFLRGCLTAVLMVAATAHSQFIPTDSGPYNYDDSANWVGGNISGVFSQTLTADQTVYFGPTLGTGLSFVFGGNFDLTLQSKFSSSTGSFGGDVLVDSVAGGRTVNIGSPLSSGQIRMDLHYSNVIFDVEATDTLAIWNGLSQTQINTGFGFVKSGAGTMILGGANIYKGAAVINAGTLQLAAGTTLSSSSTLQVNTGAALDLNGTSQTVSNLSGTGGNILLGTGTLTIGAGSGTSNAVISGSGAIVKSGQDTTTSLRGANTYTGATNLNSGTLNVAADNNLGAAPTSPTGNLIFNGGILQFGASFNLDANRSITVNVSGGTIDTNGFNSIYAGTISGSGNFSKTGLGNLQLTHANSFSGPTGIYGGTLTLDQTNDNGNEISTGVLTLGNATLALLGSSYGPTVQTVSGLSLVNGNGAIKLTSGLGQSVTLNLGGITRYIGGSLDFTLPANGAITTTTSNITGILGGYATVGGTNWARNDGSNNITAFTAYDTNLFTAGTNTNLISRATLAAATSINSLRFNAPASVTLSVSGTNLLTIGSPGVAGGILVTSAVGNHTSGITGGQLTSTSTDLIIHQNNTTLPFTIGSVIVDHGSPMGLTVVGPGTVKLTAVSTYTGRTTVDDGRLQISGSGRLPANTWLVLNGTAILDLNNISQTVGALSGTVGTSVLLGKGTLTVGDAYSTNFDGVISGLGGLTKSGTFSDLSLRAANTYTGPTTINGGIIRLTGGGSLPSTSALVMNGGSLLLDGVSQTVKSISGTAGYISGNGTMTISSGTSTYGGTFSGGISVVKNGIGIMTLSNHNSNSGGFTANGGTFKILSDAGLGAVPNGPITNLTLNGGTLQLGAAIFRIDGNRTMLLKGSGGIFDTNGFDTIFAGQIIGTGGLTKIGAGTLILNNWNTFTGGVTVKGGILEGWSDAAFGDPANVITINGATLVYTGTLTRNISLGALGGTLGSGNDTTFAGIISGPGALHALSNPITLTGQNTYLGGTIIAPQGIVEVAGTNRSLSTGKVTIQSGGILSLSADTNIGLRVMLQSGATLGLLTSAVNPTNVIDPRSSAGTVALNTPIYTRALDMALVGNGKLFLGSYGSSAYTASTLGAGIDGIYRLGGTNSSGGFYSHLIIGSTPNVLTGSKSLLVGSSLMPDNIEVILANANDFTGGTTLAAGTLSLGDNGSLGPGLLTLSGGTIQTYAAPITLANRISVTGNFAANGGYPLTFKGTVSFGGLARTITVGGDVVMTGVVSNGTLIKDGSGTLSLAAVNSYSGGTKIVGGTLRSTATGTLGSGAVTLGGGTLALDVVIQNFATALSVTASSGLQLDNDSTISSAISASTVGAKTLTLQGSAANGVISGPITDGLGSLSLNKGGTGTIVLSGSNGYSGGTTFTTGILSVSSDANLGAVPSVPTTNLKFDRGTLRYGAAFTLNPNRTIFLPGQPISIPTIDTNGFNVTIGSQIIGFGSNFSKSGAGTLILTGSNNYSGRTIVLGGVLQFNSLSAMGSGVVTVNSGAVVAAGYAMDQTFLNKLSKTSDAVVAVGADSSNALDFTGANWRLGATGSFTYSGTLTPNSSTYRLGGGGGTLTLANTNALTGSRNLDVDLGGTGGGTVLLNASNDYSGATNVSSGTLKLGSAANIPNTSSINLGTGATFDVTSRSPSGGFVLGSGKVLSGTGAIAGKLTLDIGSFVSPGSVNSPYGGLSFGDLTLGGTYTADIDAAGDHDILAVAGNLDLSGTADSLNVNVVDSTGGDYVLATYTGTLTGQFDNVSLPQNYTIDYGSGTDSEIRLVPDSVTFSSLQMHSELIMHGQAVPEPGSTVLILVSGFCAFGFRRRR